MVLILSNALELALAGDFVLYLLCHCAHLRYRMPKLKDTWKENLKQRQRTHPRSILPTVRDSRLEKRQKILRAKVRSAPCATQNPVRRPSSVHPLIVLIPRFLMPPKDLWLSLGIVQRTEEALLSLIWVGGFKILGVVKEDSYYLPGQGICRGGFI